MQQPRVTRHAQQRRQQRGSRPKDLAIVMAYGDIEIPARNGCCYLQLSRREAARLQREGHLNVSDIDQARRLIVLADPKGRIVTILKSSPKRRLSSLRVGGRR
jgi:hypothetical protein